ncbi:MAG: hypothetical protein JWN78_3102 [Bacteroidota bacterium]|nr:hypothetical protein [Bacteroidota bacterium]
MKKEIINLDNMPMTKALLIDYIMFMYGEAYDISHEYLVMEYLMLKRENRLHELFQQELLDNTGALEEDFIWR